MEGGVERGKGGRRECTIYIPMLDTDMEMCSVLNCLSDSIKIFKKKKDYTQ